MARFVGIKNNQINIISDKLFDCEGLQIIELPSELENISPTDLITDYKIKNGKLVSKINNLPIKELKVAFVSNWMMRCGISTYFQFLFEEMIDYLGDFKLFIEKNDIPTGPINKIGNKEISPDKIVACWKRGESLQELISEIKVYDPDILLIQHEYGIFPNARYWLSLMTQLADYRIIVVMHSVFPDHQDKMIYEASMPEIIVHLDMAKDNLKITKKLNAKVYVVPHGCYPIINQEKMWNNYKSKHTFIQQGFGFKYKNFEASIKAVSILKSKYPDIFFTALISESPYNKVGHELYYNELILLINSLNIKDNVSIIRGYQTDKVIDSYLRSNQIAVFPYLSVPGHEVFGASGAARLAMSAGIPIISSSIPHFSDLPTIKADTPKQIADALDKLFCDEQLKKEQIVKQNQFIMANSWKSVAEQYKKIIEN